MFAQAYQYHAKMSFLTMFNVRSSHPLALWARAGTGARFVRDALALTLDDSPERTAIVCPSFHDSLAISLPCLNLVLRWLDDEHESLSDAARAQFAVEVHVADDRDSVRRIRVSCEYESVRVTPELACVPLLQQQPAPDVDAQLWQTIQLDLAALTRRFYPHVEYRRTDRIVVTAPCQLRFIFFAARAVASDAWPLEFRSVA